ncbi:MAG: tetratricopeptide repeat protein [Pseudomonadales bacterium]|nr:tetratricopeptide repeat protein [Pseudomonadales bacterium]
MAENLPEHEFNQALKAIEEDSISAIEKVDLLIQIATGLQQKPKSPQQLHNAVTLYEKALALCPVSETLLMARTYARKGTALQAIPDDGTDYLFKAQAEFEVALPVLNQLGTPEEAAEAEMNLGLVLQSLAGMHAVPITEAIEAYQRALKVFTRIAYPTEYAILHNNLATVYLSMPMNNEHGKMREAMAVQSFQEALKIITLIDQPSEYAMLQNNLGNALQYASSSHAVENNLRALDAYDEALKVRNSNDTPYEYANTICNKANCLCNLPDDLDKPEEGNRDRLRLARDYYRQANDIFMQHGDMAKVNMINETLKQLDADIGTGKAGSRDGKGFGETRI